MLACVCAIDRAAFPPGLLGPGDVTGFTELVANALILDGEIPREYNLRGGSQRPPGRGWPGAH
jgi:hypothetical protein